MRPDLLSLEDKTEDRLKAIAHRASTDFYFFCKEILGYKDIRPAPHQELCDMLERPGKRKKLILMARGAFKSSIANAGYALWMMVHNPNIRIMISSENQKKSQKFLAEIKGHIESNEKFKAVFGDWVSSDKTWRDDELVINRRTKVIREPSVMAVSLEKMSSVGYHQDLIILDDVVGPLTVTNPENIEKTIEHYKLLLSVLDPGADKRMIIIGTRWHVDDLYGWILAPDVGERDQFDVIIKPAIAEDGSLLLPDRLTREFLDDQRQTQGDYTFSCNYLLRAISDANQTFKQTDVKFYETSPPGLIYFMTIDLAVSLKAAADFTGVIVNGVDCHHHWYVQEAIQRRMEFSDTIELLFKLNERYQPMMCLGMEKFVLEKAFQTTLHQEMLRRNVFIPIKEIPTDNRNSKEVRIRALQPRFQAGQIMIKREHEALYNQIVYHPQVKHDDLIDALKSQLAITFPGPQIEVKEETKYAHLTPKEQKIWKDAAKLGRKVRQTRWDNMI